MKVLILEPDPTLRNNYGVYARDDCNYEVITAEDGTFLSQNWEEVQTCNIIVIDFLVPFGGLNCIELLTERGWTKPILLHHTSRWHGDLSLTDLKRITKTHPNVTFKRKSFDGANLIWFLQKHIP